MGQRTWYGWDCGILLRDPFLRAIVRLRPSFSAQVRLGEPGAPVDSLRTVIGLKSTQVEGCGAPHLAKNEREMWGTLVLLRLRYSSLRKIVAGSRRQIGRRHR